MDIFDTGMPGAALLIVSVEFIGVEPVLAVE
jgi:hypothetical protein